MSGKITEQLANGCPCKHTAPCHPDCACVNPLSSSGCERCCTHGSSEQRKEQAEFIASATAHADKLAEALESARNRFIAIAERWNGNENDRAMSDMCNFAMDEACVGQGEIERILTTHHSDKPEVKTVPPEHTED